MKGSYVSLRYLGLKFSECYVGMKIKVIGDRKNILTIVDLDYDNEMIVVAFRDHRGQVVEHTMEPHVYLEA